MKPAILVFVVSSKTDWNDLGEQIRKAYEEQTKTDTPAPASNKEPSPPVLQKAKLERPTWRTSYKSDLTPKQWAKINILFDRNNPQQTYSRREIINAILFKTESLCTWEELPEGFPPYRFVRKFYYELRRTGIWSKIHDALYIKCRREYLRIMS